MRAWQSRPRRATGPRRKKRAWYQERPDDAEYYWVQRDLLRNGLTRKAKLTQLPPVREDDPLLWAIGLDGASPLKRPEAVQEAAAARQPGLRRRAHGGREAAAPGRVGRGARGDAAVPPLRQRRIGGAVPEMGPRCQFAERPEGTQDGLLWAGQERRLGPPAARQLLRRSLCHGRAWTTCLLPSRPAIAISATWRTSNYCTAEDKVA